MIYCTYQLERSKQQDPNTRHEQHKHWLLHPQLPGMQGFLFGAVQPCLISLPHLVQLDLSSDPIAQNLKSHFRAALAGSLLQGHKSHTPCDVMLYILLHSIFKCTFDQQLHPVLQGGSNSDSIRLHCVAPFLRPDSTCQSYPPYAVDQMSSSIFKAKRHWLPRSQDIIATLMLTFWRHWCSYKFMMLHCIYACITMKYETIDYHYKIYIKIWNHCIVDQTEKVSSTPDMMFLFVTPVYVFLHSTWKNAISVLFKCQWEKKVITFYFDAQLRCLSAKAQCPEGHVARRAVLAPPSKTVCCRPLLLHWSLHFWTPEVSRFQTSSR